MRSGGEGGMICRTADGIEHGDAHLEDCLEAVVTRFSDGFVLCPILWSGGKCEECMEVLDRRTE